MEDLPDESECDCCEEEEEDETQEESESNLLRIYYTRISLTQNPETGEVEVRQTTDPDAAAAAIQSVWQKFSNQKKKSEAAKKIQTAWRKKSKKEIQI